MASEKWVVVAAHPDYEVSDRGRVCSHKRREPRILQQFRRKDGYCTVNMDHSTVKVHQIVAEAFVGPRPEGLDVAHFNGVRHDNQRSNLRYATRASNHADKARHGTQPRGESSVNSKLTAVQVAEIRLRYVRRRVTHQQLASEFGVTREAVGRVVRGETWAA